MLIKHKLIANTLVLVAAMLSMLAIINFSVSSLEDDLEIAREVANVETEVLQLRRHEKDFLARKDLKYQEKFNKQMNGLKKDVNTLDDSFRDAGVEIEEINALRKILQEYHQHFASLVASQQKIGLHPKDGLYGALRAAVHEVEELIGTSDYELRAGMLQLRRNEKDFMLRLDDKYVDKLDKNIALLKDKVNNSEFPSGQQEQINDLLANYQSAFLDLVREQKRLGYSSANGILKEMRSTVHQVDKVMASLLEKNNELVESHKSWINITSYSIAFIVLIIAVGFAVVLTRSIISAITEMKSTMEVVAKTNDLTVVVNDSGKDELSDMAKVFNAMITSFRSLIVEVNHSVTTLNSATQTLAENISVSNVGVEAQIQETDMVATAVTEMVATVDEIASNTNEAANKAEMTNHNADQGKQGVDKTINQIELLSEKLLESENVVNELAKDSDTIGSVLDVIRGIAEQTNLLALNAAIEAARAGEQGRGFAVVADEVRTLASRTQDSTQEIEGIISSLQGRTKEIVEHMASCRTQGHSSAEQASIAGTMLEEINQDVSTIMEMNTAIATAIKEQSAVASEVNQHVVSIRDVAEQSGSSAQQNAHMSEELSQQADVLNNEVSRFKV
ncbi:methyl-accepting chemotaxis protein [Thalassomonas haliotis]|uniref:Methyl-accepting chemotaxis protein n=1 Tax=Thalassomonas haliotis TaxID=485448 RepID=A0ABY7VE61_9GAMM|nr:methyl-accepting chemotaxis protein [Thalassomonas haliotis]WDE11183.1 methyl-accepting chemotaxis protein [Thalassomonas haliotis]